MSTKLPFDDNLIVKAFKQGQAGAPLAEQIDTVIHGSDNIVEDENCVKTDTEEPKSAGAMFVVGDYVRCTYDDGIDYEAKILYINSKKGTCRIRYVGYENEQTVDMVNLIASWGEEARQTQCDAAAADKMVEEATEKASKKTTSRIFNPPPVPPIPPNVFDSDDEEKNQQFAQLLISWFMTGYYTGLHQRTMHESKKLKK